MNAFITVSNDLKILGGNFEFILLIKNLFGEALTSVSKFDVIHTNKRFIDLIYVQLIDIILN